MKFYLFFLLVIVTTCLSCKKKEDPRPVSRNPENGGKTPGYIGDPYSYLNEDPFVEFILKDSLYTLKKLFVEKDEIYQQFEITAASKSDTLKFYIPLELEAQDVYNEQDGVYAEIFLGSENSQYLLLEGEVHIDIVRDNRVVGKFGFTMVDNLLAPSQTVNLSGGRFNFVY